MTALQYSEYYLVTTIYPGFSGVTKPNGKIKQIAETKTVSAIFVMSLSGRIKHIVGQRIYNATKRVGEELPMRFSIDRFLKIDI